MDPMRPRDPFDDIDLGPGVDQTDAPSGTNGPLLEPSQRRERALAPLVGGLLAGTLLLAGIVYWAFLRPAPAPPELPGGAEIERSPAQPAPPATVSLPAPDAAPALELPGLDASDELVRRLVAALSARPELARWLVGEHLVRRFVATVDNIAEGAHPRSHLPTTRLDAPFVAEETPAGLVIDSRSFDRYDALVALFESVDPDGAARLYHQLRPLIDQAYRDLGYPDRRFDDTLVKAIRHLLATPVPPERPVVEAKVASYRWADPELEALSSAQRQLLRTGPDNVRRVQSHLGRIAVSLGVPPSAL